MVLILTGVAAVRGEIAAKQYVETRKNSTLDGDFITAPLSKNNDNNIVHSKSTRNLKKLRGSLSKMALSVKRTASDASMSSKKPNQQYSQQQYPTGNRAIAIFQPGQEVKLRNMKDPRLNGCRALVLLQDEFDIGGEVLVQFLEQQNGHDNYHETGMRVRPENLSHVGEISPDLEDDNNDIDVDASCNGGAATLAAMDNIHEEDVREDEAFQHPEASSTSATTVNNNNASTMMGALIELQNLSAASGKNGRRGMIVDPPDEMVIGAGRVAVKLLDSNGTISLHQPQQKDNNSHGLISVKIENCKVIPDVW